MNHNKLFITVFIFGMLISILINYFNFQIGYFFITLSMTLMTSILIVKELKVIVKYSLAYMFNLKTDFFDKNIERPRLFTYIVFGALSVFIIIQYHHLRFINYPLLFHFVFSDFSSMQLLFTFYLA